MGVCIIFVEGPILHRTLDRCGGSDGGLALTVVRSRDAVVA
jgi:hypothetical protein